MHHANMSTERKHSENTGYVIVAICYVYNYGYTFNIIIIILKLSDT